MPERGWRERVHPTEDAATVYAAKVQARPAVEPGWSKAFHVWWENTKRDRVRPDYWLARGLWRRGWEARCRASTAAPESDST